MTTNIIENCESYHEYVCAIEEAILDLENKLQPLLVYHYNKAKNKPYESDEYQECLSFFKKIEEYVAQEYNVSAVEIIDENACDPANDAYLSIRYCGITEEEWHKLAYPTVSVTLQVYDTHGTLVRMILDGEEFQRDVINVDNHKNLKDGTYKVIKYAVKKFADDVQHLQLDHEYDAVPQEFYVDNFILGYLMSESYTIDKDVLYVPIDEDSVIINVHINFGPLDKIWD